MSFAANVLTHRSYRRRHVVGLLALTLSLIWGGLWCVTATFFNREVDGWVTASAANGTPLTFASRRIDGTPLTIHIHLEQFQAQGAGHELKAGEAVLYVNLLNWNKISTKLRNKITGHVNNLAFAADTVKFGFSRPEHPPLNYAGTGFSLWAQALGLTLVSQTPLPLGNRIDNLAFDVRVMGTPPDFSKPSSIRQWNEASGVLEFDQLDVAWGPFGISAKGTLGLNPELQPEGAFSGKVEGLDETIDTLVTKGVIEQRQEALLRSSISVLSRPSSVMGASAPIVPISIQGGALYLGPVRILKLAPLTWPSETPAHEPS